MSKGKTKTYEYKLLESQVLMTPMGPLNAIKVRRMQKEKKERWFKTTSRLSYFFQSTIRRLV